MLINNMDGHSDPVIKQYIIENNSKKKKEKKKKINSNKILQQGRNSMRETRAFI